MVKMVWGEQGAFMSVLGVVGDADRVYHMGTSETAWLQGIKGELGGLDRVSG